MPKRYEAVFYGEDLQELMDKINDKENLIDNIEVKDTYKDKRVLITWDIEKPEEYWEEKRKDRRSKKRKDRKQFELEFEYDIVDYRYLDGFKSIVHRFDMEMDFLEFNLSKTTLKEIIVEVQKYTNCNKESLNLDNMFHNLYELFKEIYIEPSVTFLEDCFKD